MSDSDKKWDEIPSLNLEMDGDYESRLKGKEGRRHERVDARSLQKILPSSKSIIPIRISTASNGIFDGVIADLSQSGVRITSPKDLDRGEKVKVGLIIDERSIITKAIVRWICSSEMYTTAGLEFVDMPDGDQEFLRALATASLFNKTGAFRI